MGDISRSQKYGNACTFDERAAYHFERTAYNIELAFPDTETFFGITPLPAPSVPDEALTAADENETTDDASYRLLTQLALAMVPDGAGDLAVIDFTVALLHTLGYLRRPHAIRTRKELGLLVRGERKSVVIDVCVIEQTRSMSNIVLLVQEDRGLRSATDAFAQLLAGAIAAFQTNNVVRENHFLDPLETMVFPAIIMMGTYPRFFKIPVTRELSQCVERGQSPPTPTVVLGHVPELPRPNVRRTLEGMVPLDNRRAFLQCFEAFKRSVI